MSFLESIRIFRRVAETKSFSSVAREFGVTQPTISKSLKALEQQLELVLLRRSTRGLSLTVEGERLYTSGAALLDHYERVLAEVKTQKLELNGELRIAASLAFARVVLVPLLPDFEKRHPNIKLNFLLNDGFTDLIEDRIDVAIRIGELPDSELRAVKVGSFKRCLYASKSYLRKRKLPKSPGELASHKLLFYTRLEEGPQWSVVDKNGKIVKIKFEPSIKTDGSDLMREAMLEGLGIAMLPTWLMIQPERDGKVVRLFEAAHRPANIFAVSASGRELTSKQKAFIDFLKEKFETIPALSLR